MQLEMIQLEEVTFDVSDEALEKMDDSFSASIGSFCTGGGC